MAVSCCLGASGSVSKEDLKVFTQLVAACVSADPTSFKLSKRYREEVEKHLRATLQYDLPALLCLFLPLESQALRGCFHSASRKRHSRTSLCSSTEERRYSLRSKCRLFPRSQRRRSASLLLRTGRTRQNR